MRKFFSLLMMVTAMNCFASDGGRLLVSGGITGFEGSAGGGITPWALIAGYGSFEQIQGTASLQTLNTGEYQLKTFGAAVGFYDRIEMSIQRQQLTVSSSVVGNVFNVLTNGIIKNAPGTDIEQDIFGVKVKLWGDAIFSESIWAPQVSLGLQHKKNRDFNTSLALADGSVPLSNKGVPQILGAIDDSGTDIYLTATKYWLGFANGNNLLLNITARLSKANTFGLLGFASEEQQKSKLEWEGSIVITPSPETAIGVEWRTQSDRLGGLAKEDTVTDIFIAYFPSKNWSITAAYVDLGNLPFDEKAQGFYLTITGNI
jgi:hypothetical protein